MRIFLWIWLGIMAWTATADKPVLEIYLSPVPAESHGQWILYVFDNPADFPIHPEKAFIHKILDLHTPQPIRISLPEGEYAVSVYLDENANGKIDRNWLGIPSEPYALSGNPKFHFGPPRFDECKIEVKAPVTVLHLQVED